MLRNYVKVAVRNLGRWKGYAAINVFGLAIGIACFVLIALYVHDELRYDRYHTKADRIYRVVEIIEGAEESASNPLPVYVAMRRWLEDFAYRIDLGVDVFLLAGGLAATIALLTVGWQAYRTATADPVQALRYE